MRKMVSIAPMLAMAAACTAGAQPGDTSGEAPQRSFDVGEFRSIALEGPHDVAVSVGGAHSVTAEGGAEALDRLEIVVEDGKLRIRNRDRRGWFSSGERRPVTVRVSIPQIEGASIGGSGDMRIDRVQGERFSAAIGGSGDMEIERVEVGETSFSVAGSGNIRAAGAARRASISVAGSGDLALDSLETATAAVQIVGSGDVRARVTERAQVSVMGSGDVTISGPAQCTVNKMGSGNVRCGN